MERHLAGSRQLGRNWGLILVLVLCVAFWVFVTMFVTAQT
jgi:uncharacterized membrane-anchored protein